MIKKLIVTEIPEGGLKKVLVELKDHTWTEEAIALFEAHKATTIFYDDSACAYVWSKEGIVPKDKDLKVVRVKSIL